MQPIRRHHSDYLGSHLLATFNDATRIQVQSNDMPGDDDNGLYDEKQPDLPMLLLVTAPVPDPALQDHLAGIEALAGLTPVCG